MDTFELEKLIWDESDFENMGWHDSQIWSLFANPDAFEFLVDLDYIFKWVCPPEGEKYFQFWVAPATMVFENVHDIKIQLASEQGTIEVADLLREEPSLVPNGRFTQYRYRFECQEGKISLMATGYKMFVRRRPILQRRQGLSLTERKGVGFARGLDVA